LHLLSALPSPLIVLLHIIEVPSRTAALDPELYRKEIKDAEERLDELSEWLKGQGMNVRSKAAIARGVAEGIITETESGNYMIVFLMKRRVPGGWRSFFRRSVSEKVVRYANCLVMTAPLEQLSRVTE
jgi:nucleotide-binding universal stress UspA family protein